MKIPPVCMILAGGQGSRLNALAWHRAKPAVPFAGIHRLIDFTLSNSANSGILRIGVLTQYLPLSLMDHIGAGESWDMSARTRECRILPPNEGASAKDWYLGTAHAIATNSDFIQRGPENEILILSGDHIYHMDYREMIQFHREKKAHFTIATMPVPKEDAHRFGIAVVDDNNRVIQFQEKPEVPLGTLGSMGVYIADRDVTLSRINELVSQGKTDIGGDLVPSLIQDSRVFAFPFKGYWRDVGTLGSFWDCSMDLIKPELSGLDLQRWSMRTNLNSSEIYDRSPTSFGHNAQITESYISQGCRIEGRVHRSVLSPGVVVEKNAEVVDSVLFHDIRVCQGSKVFKTISDKFTVIGPGAVLKPSENDSVNTAFPDHLNSGIILLGNRSLVPENARVSGNCLVFPEVTESDWTSRILESGETLKNH
ncbi:glucose-1-phosphate adenylyltransferase [bacterium]|nr:glucose-1-phosphate adenylyltransferase [bacterium]